MSLERSYFERMAQAHSSTDREQYLRYVAEADQLLRQDRERRIRDTLRRKS